MVKDVYINIQFKVKMNDLQYDLFKLMREVCQECLLSILLYIIMVEVREGFINASKRIKETQIWNDEIEIVTFTDDTTMFLRDIPCLDRIQGILRLYEDASSSKINF